MYKLADILEVEVSELLEIKASNQFNQTNNEHTTGYLQQTANFYQESKDQNQKIIELYEARLEDKNRLITRLEKLIK